MEGENNRIKYSRLKVDMYHVGKEITIGRMERIRAGGYKMSNIFLGPSAK